jgi:peptide/nickel transport system substrate-binding protein
MIQNAKSNSGPKVDRDKIRKRLEQEAKGEDIPPRHEPIPIFWEDRDIEQNIFEKIRSFFWFFPDFLLQIIHKTRPFSFIIFYSALTLISWRAITYATNSPESLFNYQPKQVLHEAAVGKIDILNPLFTTHNQLERDLQELIFNSLIRIGPDGIPQKEIAQSWAISGDGKTYTFFIKENVYWHDGEKLTADDVVFTFNTIQQLKDEDSYYTAFKDVDIGKLDDFTVIFNLPEPNATFMENLSVGIVPKHLLENVRPANLRSIPYNQYPIGTGPFQITKNDEKQVVLKNNTKYFEKAPKLKKITYNFYQEEDTLLQDFKQFKYHTFTNPSLEALQKIENYQIYSTKTFTIHLRDKIIFFNLRKENSPLANEKVRQALSRATDRNNLIKEIDSSGEIAHGPISKYSWAYNKSLKRYMFDIEKANKQLSNAGWEYKLDNGNRSKYRQKDGQELMIKLSLLDTSINSKIASELKKQWALVGVNLIIDTQEYEKIASETISRRDFEALLFQVENTPDPDKYNFWHSIKAEYPGLNLSGYSYNRVDILLERARKEPNRTKRKEDYDLMQKYVVEDVPALFLYHPTYKFVVHKNVEGIDLEDVSLPHQRYNNVHKWYIAKD